MQYYSTKETYLMPFLLEDLFIQYVLSVNNLMTKTIQRALTAERQLT